MAKRLDAERIEKARQKDQMVDHREEEKRRIQETIAKNRSGERKGHVIMPERKMYAYEEAPKVRVAAYCRVSTAEEAQVGSFEMQVQHFKSVIENNPTYELVKIYTDAAAIIGLNQKPEANGRRFSPFSLVSAHFKANGGCNCLI